jgi:hypothetical protein
MPTKLAFTCAFVVFLATGTFAQKISQEDSLRGLSGVSVFVDQINSEAQRDGLARAQVQTDVELRLRKAGIRVLPNADPEVPLFPQLYIKVRAVKRREFNLYAFSITVQVNDFVDLRRKPTRSAVVTVWDTDTAGSVGTDNIRAVRDSVGDLVDEFVNHYLAQNPK